MPNLPKPTINWIKSLAYKMKFSIIAAATLPIQGLLCLGTNALGAEANFWDEIPASPSTLMPLQVKDDYWSGQFQRVNREVSQAQQTAMVFFGDSITWNWSLGSTKGQEVWQENYARYHPINMGNSGDITPVMLYRVTHGNLDFVVGKHPKVAVLLCGVNNFMVTQSDGGKEKWDLGAKCPPVDIAEGKRAIAQVFRRRLPTTRLILLGILPVADKVKWAKCQQVNASNAAVVSNRDEVVYLDLQDKFLQADRSLNASLFTDGIHLTTEGYRVWAQGIEPVVQQLMEAPPLAPKKIMLIGDSLTEGPDSNASYRRYLDGMLRRSGHLIDFIGSRKKHHDDKTEPDNYQYDVDHEGHWGKDTAWMAEHLPGLLTTDVPDVAVIQLGTDEIASSKTAAGPLTDQMILNLKQVIAALRSKNANVKIVLSKLLPLPGKKAVIDLLNEKIATYTQSHSSSLQPMVLADPNAGWAATKDVTSDGLLPTVSGASKLTGTISAAINRLLEMPK